MTMAAVAKAILVVAKAVAREENMAVVRGAHTARQYIPPKVYQNLSITPPSFWRSEKSLAVCAPPLMNLVNSLSMAFQLVTSPPLLKPLAHPLLACS